MTQEQVLSVMGYPKQTHFAGNAELWQYCKMGLVLDTVVSLIFQDGRLYAVLKKSELCSL